jgi:hypothetical protein
MMFDATFNNISVINNLLTDKSVHTIKINAGIFIIYSPCWYYIILIFSPLIYSEHAELESKIEYKVI